MSKRKKRRPQGQYCIGSNVKLPFFRKEGEPNDYTMWVVTWRWPWGNVTKRYRINLPNNEIKKTLDKSPTLWDMVKFITDWKHSDMLHEHNDNGFKQWLEAVDNGDTIRHLISMHFATSNLEDPMDQKKITSFLALPELRNLVTADQIQALGTTLESMSDKEKAKLTLSWLSHTLGA